VTVSVGNDKHHAKFVRISDLHVEYSYRDRPRTKHYTIGNRFIYRFNSFS
jgi:hypothetical protein